MAAVLGGARDLKFNRSLSSNKASFHGLMASFECLMVKIPEKISNYTQSKIATVFLDLLPKGPLIPLSLICFSSSKDQVRC